MSEDLDDLLTLDEAADIAGRAAVSLRRAAVNGRLRARRFGTEPRTVWITTRQAVSEYLAYVAAAAWHAQPQVNRRPGGHPRRSRRRGPPG